MNFINITVAIKPCPFCGSEDVEFTRDYEVKDLSRVLCRRCGASSGSDTKEIVSLHRWNKRAEI